MSQLTRRTLLQKGAIAVAASLATRWPAWADAPGDTLVPFIDPQPIDPKKASLHWAELTDWITPKDQFFNVGHYGTAEVKTDGYALEIDGRVDQPTTLTLAQLKALPRKEVTATLECSGNGASPTFSAAIGNAKWGGTPLAGVLKAAGVTKEAVEVAFWGHDKGKEKIRGGEYEQHFARTLPIADALSRDDVLLAYEMNGEPLTAGHGAPLRLVVPGWYGIAWVKWLARIELRDHKLMNRFTARDYVTLRGEERADGSVDWKESSVGPMNVKSMVARVVKRPDGNCTVSGAAWSGPSPVRSVEIKVDDNEWASAKVDETHAEPFTWRFWSFDWKSPAPGEHALVSRAIDAEANIQPTADDAAIKLKKTYWEANQQVVRKVRI